MDSINPTNLIKIQRYTALTELGKSLAMTFKTQDVLVLLIETISKTFMVPGGVYTILILENSNSKAGHIVRYSRDREKDAGLNRERLNPSEPYNAWVAKQNKPLFVGEVMTDSRFPTDSKENGVRTLVSAPMIYGNEILGLVRIESCFPDVFQKEDAELLTNFANLGAQSLAQVSLFRQTIDLAIHDELTGLYNQRHFKDRVKDEILRAQEYKLPLSLMMLDMDHFKAYNDRYGHLACNKVLQIVAQILKETVRTVDLVACYGGEIFSVLLLKTPLTTAEIVAKRMCLKVEEQEIDVVGAITHVTISIGVAELSPAIKEAEDFIDLADKALYQAKAEGRNLVRCAKMGSLSP